MFSIVVAFEWIIITKNRYSNILNGCISTHNKMPCQCQPIAESIQSFIHLELWLNAKDVIFIWHAKLLRKYQTDK